MVGASFSAMPVKNDSKDMVDPKIEGDDRKSESQNRLQKGTMSQMSEVSTLITQHTTLEIL